MQMAVSMAPAGLLGALIESIWLHEAPAPRGGAERRLPTGRVELVVNLREDRFALPDGLGGHDHYPGTVVAGPFARPYALERAQQTCVLGVVFKPAAARPLIGQPMHELSGRHVALADLWGGHAADELRELALEAPTLHERLAAVERVLERRLARAAQATHPHAVESVAWIARAPARYGVAQLSDWLGWTPRRLQQVFRADVGLTPREYQRLARFRVTLANVDAAAEIGWAAFALRHGYCDQPHLIREFRAHAGLAPSEYLQLRGPALNHVPA
jgi:AraC-like DNA-binding protein